MTKLLSQTDVASTKIVNLANGTASTDAAAFGQIPVIDATAADIAAVGTQAAGSSTKTPAADHVHAAGGWIPSDNALLAGVGDPATFVSTVIMTAGTLYLTKLQIRAPITITNLWWACTTIGAGSSTQSFAGLYNSSGTLLSGSSDIGSTFTSSGGKSCALTTPQAVGTGFVWAALLMNLGTTQPTLARGVPSATSCNLGLSATTFRFCVNGTTLTALPSPITTSSNTATGGQPFWAGAS